MGTDVSVFGPLTPSVYSVVICLELRPSEVEAWLLILFCGLKIAAFTAKV